MLDGLIAGLIAPALGIVLSPLAIMALVAELLSARRRENGVAFLIGWTAATALIVAAAVAIFTAVDFAPRDAAVPVWVSVVRVLLGIALLGAAVWVYRRGRSRVQAMRTASTPEEVAAAAPQLPGWLQQVSHFTPARSVLLGAALFAVNPVDASCAVIAGVDLASADVSGAAAAAVAVGFVAVAVAPIAVPVAYVLARGAGAERPLNRLRDWIADHTTVVNVVLVVLIGLLQIEKGAAALL